MLSVLVAGVDCGLATLGTLEALAKRQHPWPRAAFAGLDGEEVARGCLADESIALLTFFVCPFLDFSSLRPIFQFLFSSPAPWFVCRLLFPRFLLLLFSGEGRVEVRSSGEGKCVV